MRLQGVSRITSIMAMDHVVRSPEPRQRRHREHNGTRWLRAINQRRQRSHRLRQMLEHVKQADEVEPLSRKWEWNRQGSAFHTPDAATTCMHQRQLIHFETGDSAKLLQHREIAAGSTSRVKHTGIRRKHDRPDSSLDKESTPAKPPMGLLLASQQLERITIHDRR